MDNFNNYQLWHKMWCFIGDPMLSKILSIKDCKSMLNGGVFS